MIRRQLPAYSPISLSALVRAAGAVLRDSGSAVESLRAHLERRFEADWALLTGSGTQALQLALQSLDPVSTERAPVVMPAYSCFDLVTAAVGAGAPVRFYDLDPVTLSPDPASLERVTSRGCRAIVGANLYGFPVDWDLLRSVADASDAVLIEDAAQGLGSTWKGREFGRFGDLTVLSFGRGKGWTGGGGGALLGRGRGSSGAAVPESGLRRPPRSTGARCLITLTATWALGRPALYRIPTAIPVLALGETRYKEPTQPMGISPLAAAITSRHEASSFGVGEARQRRAGRLDRIVGGSDRGVACEPLESGGAGFLRYPLLARSAAEAERLAESGCGMGVARGYPLALPDLPVLRDGRAATCDRPGTRRLVERLLTFPTHPRTTRADASRLEALLRRSEEA